MKTKPCFCQSYYDDDNVLRDCTCGECGKDDWVIGEAKTTGYVLGKEPINPNPAYGRDERSVKFYQGEVGNMYEVTYKYKSSEGWLKRRLVDVYLFFKEKLWK
jgi:hypothetical protein